MVIVKLYGGLGNQMFQYAVGLALSTRLKTNLYLNLDWFEEVKKVSEATKRVYELDGFGIVPKSLTVLDKINLHINPLKVFKEESLDYQFSFKKLNGNIVLDGYWQSHKYFEEYRQEISEAFTFPLKIARSNKLILDKIIKSQSVSIHIRRGDYVSSEHTSKYHGVVPLSYYERAIENLSKKVEKPTLFVFSDDVQWAKQNIRLKQPTTFVSNNGPSSGIEDMRLMSACKHNVIANSSFSWWAAWLNQYDNKQVYAPRNWFKVTNSNLDDRLPREWKKL